MDILYTPIRCAGSAEVSFATPKHMPMAFLLSCGHVALLANPSLNGSNLQRMIRCITLVIPSQVMQFAELLLVGHSSLLYSNIVTTQLHKAAGCFLCRAHIEHSQHEINQLIVHSSRCKMSSS